MSFRQKFCLLLFAAAAVWLLWEELHWSMPFSVGGYLVTLGWLWMWMAVVLFAAVMLMSLVIGGRGYCEPSDNSSSIAKVSSHSAATS